MSSTETNASVVSGLGFANLPNQVHRKYVKKGFEFTLMVCGESGLGKSTLINCIFMANINANRKIPSLAEQMERTLQIVTNTVDIEERGVKLKLTVVDTPGYGDSLDNSDNYQPIINYIDEQYEKYLHHESGLNRRHIFDSRVHCCFYFVSPLNYGLKPVDIQFMKLLHEKVNIVPIIAKSDFLTKDEVQVLKKRVLNELKSHNIRIYQIPDCDADEDDDYKEHVRQLKAAIPFAVCSSLETHEVKGKKVKGRAYPWGIVETENPEHSDFVKLRSMLVTHMQDLREVTQDVHYENYRTLRLAGKIDSKFDMKDNISISGDDSEKDRILQEKEAELRRMQEMIAKMQEEMKNKQQSEEVNVTQPNGN